MLSTEQGAIGQRSVWTAPERREFADVIAPEWRSAASVVGRSAGVMAVRTAESATRPCLVWRRGQRAQRPPSTAASRRERSPRPVPHPASRCPTPAFTSGDHRHNEKRAEPPRCWSAWRYGWLWLSSRSVCSSERAIRSAIRRGTLRYQSDPPARPGERPLHSAAVRAWSVGSGAPAGTTSVPLTGSSR